MGNPKSEEQALIEAFMIPAKRDRFLGMLSRPKGRKKFLTGLNHFSDLDSLYMQPIPSSSQNARGVEVLLRRLGAGDTCHVISADPALDSRAMDLREALDQIIGFGCGSLLSCVTGKVGYYEGESPKDRCILYRQPNPAMQTDRPSADR